MRLYSPPIIGAIGSGTGSSVASRFVPLFA
jgi:hypothetical protein